MKAGHEIKPKQVRALVLLLVLVPLIPMVLMVRFMFASAAGTRVATQERLSTLYHEHLRSVAGAYAAHLRALPVPPDDPVEHARAFFERAVDAQVIVDVVAAGARLPDETIASARVESSPRLIEVALRLQPGVLEEAARAELISYGWIAGTVILAVGLIAGSAGLVLSRQIRLHELQNTTLATVTHELKTPLASMRVLIETLLEGRCRGEGQQREYLELIAGENARLSRLIENFLTLGRLEHGPHTLALEAVAPGELAREAVAALRVPLEMPGCDFTLDVAEGLPCVQADRDAITMVLVNLLDNALKFTGVKKRIVLRARAADEAVVFEVEDDGAGMSASDARLVFKRFYQADQRLSRTREGCGLGLAIAREIVEAHGGGITVASRVGEGSCFVVRLPVVS